MISLTFWVGILRDFPYAAGASSFTMPHINSKRGDFTVKELKPSEKVAKNILMICFGLSTIRVSWLLV